MGDSPLSSIIADIVMQDLEEKIFIPYYRYVDNILLVCPKDVLYDIISKFNSYYERLKFTMKLEENYFLNFLDIFLIVKDNKIIIDRFHKESFSTIFIILFQSFKLSKNRNYIQFNKSRHIIISPFVL